MEDAIDIQRPRLGQFLLTWMKESELRQAKNILEDKCDGRYENAIRAIETELVNKKGEDGVKHGSSWLVKSLLLLIFFGFFRSPLS